MIKRLFAVAALIGSAVFTTHAIAADKSNPADDKIIDQVRMKLAVDQDVKGGALDVSSKDGVVILKGRVDSEKAKSRATHLTKKIKGVKDVDNELVVGPPTQ